MKRRTRIGSLEYVLGPDLLLGTATGIYVSTLVAPAIALVVATVVPLAGAMVALVGLGIVLVPLAGWTVVNRESTVEWLATSKLAWLVPMVGGAPVVTYLAPIVVDVNSTAVGIPATASTTTVALFGWLLGFLAVPLGVGLVSVARHRRISALVDGESAVEWQTDWNSRRRVWYAVGVIVPAYVGIVGTLWLWYPSEGGSPSAILLAIQLGLAVTFVLAAPTKEHTYRVTPVGIERRGPLPPRLYRWDQFEGFSVTDVAIVLHRPPRRLDLRCSRREVLESEEEIVAALEQHLERVG